MPLGPITLPALHCLLALMGVQDGATPAAFPASPQVGQASSMASVRGQVAAVLRRARIEKDEPAKPFIEELAAAGELAVPACLDMLEREFVPALELGEEPQVLSEPQREILLGALGMLPPELVLVSAHARVEPVEGLRERLFLLRVLGVAGGINHLEELVALTLEEQEEELSSALEQAMRKAMARILRRQPPAFDGLPRLMRASRPELGPAMILAAGDTGDPRALALFNDAITLRPELTSMVAAQVRRVGRSPEAWLNADMAESLRGHIDPDSPQTCRALVLALGELRDYASIPTLIGLLESSDSGLSQNALWALRRVTDLSFTGSPERWQQWYDQETAWFEHVEPGILEDLVSGKPAVVSKALREIGRRRTQREGLAAEVLVVLERSEPTLRAQACDTLALLGAELALPALVERLESDIPYCSQAAWRALGSISGLELPAEGAAWREALDLDA